MDRPEFSLAHALQGHLEQFPTVDVDPAMSLGYALAQAFALLPLDEAGASLAGVLDGRRHSDGVPDLVQIHAATLLLVVVCRQAAKKLGVSPEQLLRPLEDQLRIHGTIYA